MASDSTEDSHLLLAIFFALAFAPVRFLLDSLVYKRLANRILYSGFVPSMLDEARQLKFAKCMESLWKLTYYAAMHIWVILILKKTHWALKPNEYFMGWPNQELGLQMKLLYLCECGFYLYSIVALLAWDIRRKDFSIMMSHHIITSILIGLSYWMRFFRIGTVILALHDASDVFLESAKIFKYAEKEMAASLFFSFFALSWLLLRLIFFPFWIIRASSYYLIETLVKSATEYPRTLYYFFNVMLITLLIFHMYWGRLICAMIIRQLRNRGRVGEDIRSDSEDE